MNPDLNPISRALPLYDLVRPSVLTPAPAAAPFVPTGKSGLSEPGYHPQILPPAAPAANASPACAAPGPYSLPADSTLAQTAGGQQAQPFDVTLSQLATAVYGTRGDPPAGWTAIGDSEIAERLGIADKPQTEQDAQVDAWRHQFLGGGDQTTAQEFKAEIYQDCDGDFVLSYRGTAEGMDDWMNNFKQGTGFETDSVDKFSGTSVNTAVEFKRVFGEPQGSNPTNLAITGHSQGGGLATVGSLATGVPAVTFDASGIHPNTLDRMGLADPQQARDIAEGGQIRAYSLKSDLLTGTQESGPLGLLAPDALGTKIVVEPGVVGQHTLFGRGTGSEFDLPVPAQAALNGLVEMARYSPVPLVNGIGDLAYGAMSHSPDLLTSAMIERQPWQPGYENPSDPGKTLQDLVPDVLKDDFARNTHDTAADIVDVVNSDFKNGDYVQGGFRIGGDVIEGVWNSTGDTAHRTADIAAQAVDDRIDGPLGDLLAGTISGSGDIAHGASDLFGDGAEKLADSAGTVAQKGTDFANWLTGR